MIADVAKQGGADRGTNADRTADHALRQIEIAYITRNIRDGQGDHHSKHRR